MVHDCPRRSACRPNEPKTQKGIETGMSGVAAVTMSFLPHLHTSHSPAVRATSRRMARGLGENLMVVTTV